ncbi:unnamed protein product, partial [Prorocentrum cordatum]
MAPARRPRGGALVAVGALLLLRLRPAAAAPPVDDTLAGMLGKIKSDPALLQERHESHGHVLLGEPKSQKEASAACMLDSAAAIIRANGVKGIVNGLQFDLAACCRKDEFACREDVGEAYGLLTQLRHGRTSGAEAQAVEAHAAALLLGAARKRVGIPRVRLPYARPAVPELLLGGPDGVHHAGAQGRRLSIEPRFTGAVRWRAGRATVTQDAALGRSHSCVCVCAIGVSLGPFGGFRVRARVSGGPSGRSGHPPGRLSPRRSRRHAPRGRTPPRRTDGSARTPPASSPRLP